jgi:hypothetical protein
MDGSSTAHNQPRRITDLPATSASLYGFQRWPPLLPWDLLYHFGIGE